MVHVQACVGFDPRVRSGEDEHLAAVRATRMLRLSLQTNASFDATLTAAIALMANVSAPCHR
jgi:hypothetical protein